MRYWLDAITRKYSPGLLGIASNTGWLLFDRIVRLGVGFLVTAWVARYLGPGQFGLLSYALAFVLLFGAISTLGLTNIVVRDIVREPFNRDEILGTTFVMRFATGVAALLLAIGTVYLLRPSDELTYWLVAIVSAGMLFQSFDAIDLWFQSQVKAKYTVLAKSAAYLMTALFRVVLVLAGASLIAFAWAQLAEMMLGALGLVIAYRLYGLRLRAWRAHITVARKLLSQSWPLIFSGLAVAAYMRIDLIMLGELATPRAVGIYSAATRLSELWYFIPVAIASSVLPSLVQSRETDNSLYLRRLQQLLNLFVALAIIIAVPLTFFSGPLVVLLFGQEYAAAGPVLAIHIWSAVFVFLGVGISNWVTAEGLFRASLAATSLGAVANVALNFWLIPAYSALGAAIATLLSYALAGYFLNPFVYAGRPIFLMQTRALFTFYRALDWRSYGRR